MTKKQYEILTAANYDELSRRAAQEFVRRAGEAVQARGIFTVALSGGSTPKGLYTLLGSDPYRERVPWSKVHVFWSDERCVPPDHPDSNYRMTKMLLLNKVPIPEENIHRIPAGQEDHNRAAVEYERTIRAFFHLRVGEMPRFDLILLGMGEDGHTASLFPWTSVLEETNRIASSTYVDRLGEYRLTLTAQTINHAANVVFLISGESKSSILKEVLEGEYQPQRLPSQLIRPVNGRLLFIVNSAASCKLTQLRGGHTHDSNG